VTGPQARTRLYLVRHASTVESARGRCIGRTDVPLSAAGSDCAERLAANLAPVGLNAVYSSPLRRARATAAPIAVAAGREVVIADGLAEIDFGTLEGRTFDAIAAAEPDLYERWMKAPTEISFPGGESYADLKARAVAALDAIVTRHPGATIVVVSHGGPIRALLVHLLGLSDHAAFALAVDPGAVAEMDLSGGRSRLRSLNAAAALR
jgi:broad specificity phosphatase PhoE